MYTIKDKYMIDEENKSELVDFLWGTVKPKKDKCNCSRRNWHEHELDCLYFDDTSNASGDGQHDNEL